MAVELSLQKGLDGKVELTSTRGSGPSYFKLGFLPRSEFVLTQLEKKDKQCDGREMFLPDEAIAVWKKKISAHPILTSTEPSVKDKPALGSAQASQLTFFNAPKAETPSTSLFSPCCIL